MYLRGVNILYRAYVRAQFPAVELFTMSKYFWLKFISSIIFTISIPLKVYAQSNTTTYINLTVWHNATFMPTCQLLHKILQPNLGKWLRVQVPKCASNPLSTASFWQILIASPATRGSCFRRSALSRSILPLEYQYYWYCTWVAIRVWQYDWETGHSYAIGSYNEGTFL